jgi:uncharacterized membrane protein YoaK (UPF0700 family)
MIPTLRQFSGKHRTEAGDERLGVVLAFVAGAINAGGFLAVGTYTSHMTGMVSSIAEDLSAHQWKMALLAVAHIFSFFAGSVMSSLLVNWARRRHLHSEFALALMVEAVLLLGFGLMAAYGIVGEATGLHLLISWLCFIMGLQNGLITKISHADIRTTHMTGIITDLGIETGRLLFGKTTDGAVHWNRKKVVRLARLLSAFVVGAIAGAAVFRIFGFVSVVPFAVLLALLALLPIVDDLTRWLKPKR